MAFSAGETKCEIEGDMHKNPALPTAKDGHPQFRIKGSATCPYIPTRPEKE